MEFIKHLSTDAGFPFLPDEVEMMDSGGRSVQYSIHGSASMFLPLVLESKAIIG
jgi:hypothetical protein